MEVCEDPRSISVQQNGENKRLRLWPLGKLGHSQHRDARETSPRSGAGHCGKHRPAWMGKATSVSQLHLPEDIKAKRTPGQRAREIRSHTRHLEPESERTSLATDPGTARGSASDDAGTMTLRNARSHFLSEHGIFSREEESVQKKAVRESRKCHIHEAVESGAEQTLREALDKRCVKREQALQSTAVVLCQSDANRDAASYH